MRVSIIHNDGIAVSDVERCEYIEMVQAWRANMFGSNRFETVIWEIKKFLWEWMSRLEIGVESCK
jgi:hypothetical protein